MKRYFIAADSNMPADTSSLGHWHYIDLGSHGTAGAGHHVIVLMDEHVEPPPSWEALPHLFDARSTMEQRGHHAKLIDAGVLAHHTSLDAATALRRIHPLF